MERKGYVPSFKTGKRKVSTRSGGCRFRRNVFGRRRQKGEGEREEWEKEEKGKK